jgi:hypothetical protein
MNTDSNMGKLIALGGNLESPREAKGSDWPNVGASGPAGQESGRNQLVKLTEMQEGPMHTQDSGDNTPSVWGKADFPVMKNKGESGTAPMAMSYKRGGVDFETGQMSVNAATPEV